MKILVTGGAGFIGSHTVLRLAKEGYEVVVFDNLERSDIARLKAIENIVGNQITFFKGDLRNKKEIEDCFKKHPTVDAVLHFAAYKFVEESQQKPIKYYENNVGGTINLLDAMQSAGISKLVFSSTGGAIYGEPKSVPVSEDHPLEPESVYGHTKLLCEQIIERVTECGSVRAIALRYFNAAGADDSGMIGEYMKDAQNLIPLVFQVVLGRQRDVVEVFGNDYKTRDGTCIRDYVHVNDLADGHIKALDLLGRGTVWDVFNLGTGRGSTVLEVIQAVEEVTHKKVPYKIVERRLGDIGVSFADVSKAKRVFGFQAEYNLRRTIETAWKWYKSK